MLLLLLMIIITIIIISSDSVVVIAGRFKDLLPVGDEIFRACPHRRWDPPSLLNIVQRGFFFRGYKWPGRGVNHQPHLARRLKQEHNYASTSTVFLGRLRGKLGFFFF